MTDIGHAALLLALVFSLFTVCAAALAGLRRRPDLLLAARRSSLVTLGLVSLAVVLLVVLLFQRNYQVQYVYEHVSSTLPPVYVLSALWAGQEGSLLLWLWLVSLFGVILTQTRAAWSRALEPYALATLSVTQGFFALLLCFVSPPFVLLPARAVEGMGLNPLLQNPGMIYHPPTLFLGYAAYTVPFAYAVAALLAGRVDGEWLHGIRRWNLVAWGALGLGILLGAQWAYVELGWGGYWAWDAVENASLIPWLTGTALIHSVMIQERRGMFKVWNMLLLIGTFLLCIFATFVTRSGLIQSVHAFGRSSIGYFFLAFMALLVVLTIVLLVRRRGELRSEADTENALSREGTFLLNNILFTGLAMAVLLGTIFPAITEAVLGNALSVNRTFFDRVSQPLALFMLLLLGVCPLLGWRRSGSLSRKLPVPGGIALATVVLLFLTGVREPLAVLAFGLIAFVTGSVLEEFVRGVLARRKVTDEGPLLAFFNLFRKNRRRYGGYIVHLAIVLIALGITGEGFFKTERQATIARGEAITVGRYEVRLEDLSSPSLPGVEQNVAVVGAYAGGQRIATLKPELNLHQNVGQYVSEVAIRSTLRDDLYVALASIASDGSSVTLHVLLNPLMIWLWIGGGVMLLGTAVAFWPEGSRRVQLVAPAARRAA